jgi:tyrosyl-tRNA synthetase
VESIDRQVATLMQGSEFGDPQIKEMMTGELRQRLIDAKKEGRPLRVYCGYDVTAPDLHLGHTITIRKLRQFQDYGHDVTFLIGTFTTLIGDPSDRDEARAMALEELVRKNAQTYSDQAFKILDRQKTAVRYNYDWLSKLTFMDVISMASCFTVQQFMVRDRIRARLDKNDPIWLREFLYPLAQGYDAVHLKADVQLGATEQLFNLMAGRRLQESFGQKPLVCLTFPVLVGTDGVNRMSKSRGNYVGIAEPPENIYGKTMSIPDSIIMQYFELLTDISPEELEDLKQQVAGGANPMALKKRLAKTLVSQFYSEKEAQEAEDHFEKTVQNKEIPDDVMEYFLKIDTTCSNLLAQSGLCVSRSEAMRMIKQGAVTIDGKKVSDANEIVPKGVTIKVGKRRYLKTT